MKSILISVKQKLLTQPEWVKKKLLKLYLSSPSKIQFALAKFFIQDIVNKNNTELEEIIRH